MSFLDGAYELAQWYHEGQTYGGISYIDGHLNPVRNRAKMIAEGLKLSEEEITCIEAIALLHDVVEDTPCTLSNIRAIENIPSAVPETVWALTKDKHMTNACYLGFVVQGGFYAVLVKLADSICNLNACLAEGNPERALKYSSNINYLTVALRNEVEKRKQN